MKKIIFLIFLCSLFFGVIPASENEKNELTISTSSTFNFVEPLSESSKAKNVGELLEMMQRNERDLNDEISDFKKDKKIIYENQNKVKQAVYSLISMELLLPSTGIIVSDIARQINNSLNKTIDLEYKLNSKSKIAKFFFGGDFESANQLGAEVSENYKRISDLKELKSRCGCSSEVEKIFENQIEIIESEQNRLHKIAEAEKNKKGLFQRKI